MERLAKKLASNIAVSLGYDVEKEAVVAYGLIAIIQIILTTLLVLLFGFLAGVPVESLIVCFSVSILRKFSGGAHAGTAELCTSFSVVYCILTASISKWLLVGIYNQILMAFAIIVIFGLSFLAVYKFAPVDSPNKPIRTEQKRIRMRKGSFLVLSIYFVLALIGFAITDQFVIIKSFEISLLFGVSWQIFTLTYLGAQFIRKMNQIFIL
ncbi:MAG: accessory gene regulator B family protein [Clostridiaceae bacterium]|nr:accessory gene regulator B family protein [Clostridiaceae bacterium]